VDRSLSEPAASWLDPRCRLAATNSRRSPVHRAALQGHWVVVPTQLRCSAAVRRRSVRPAPKLRRSQQLLREEEPCEGQIALTCESLLTRSEAVRFRIVRSFSPHKHTIAAPPAPSQAKSGRGLAAHFGRALAHVEAGRLGAYRGSRADLDRAKLVLVRVMIDFICQILQRSA
jgi:hypothetical protein